MRIYFFLPTCFQICSIHVGPQVVLSFLQIRIIFEESHFLLRIKPPASYISMLNAQGFKDIPKHLGLKVFISLFLSFLSNVSDDNSFQIVTIAIISYIVLKKSKFHT